MTSTFICLMAVSFAPLCFGAAVSGAGCPPDKPEVHCFVNPCAAMLCGPGTTCVTDYCGGCNANCEPTGCYHEGKVYAAGVVFPAGDGCNTCSCSGLTAVCTKIGCPAKVCNYGGQNYKPGQTFPATDGCNTCTCSADGYVECTEMFCGCPQYKCKPCETGHVQDKNGCNTCTCKDPACEAVQCSIGYECTQGVCCPAGKKLVNCFVDPCRTKNCGLWRRCRSNYCGGCNANCE